MGLGVFALLDGRLADARAYLREAVNRDPPRPRASLLLAFMDGALPADETRRVCDELRAVAGDAVERRDVPIRFAAGGPWPRQQSFTLNGRG